MVSPAAEDANVFPGAATDALRVLHALAPGRAGGLERVVRSLTRGLAEAGHGVHVAVVLDRGAGEGHPFVTALTGSAVHLHAREFPPRAYLSEWRWIRELCGRLAPDIVHTHGYRADVVAGHAARWAGRPVVSTVHGFTGGGPRNRLYEWLQRRAFRKCRALVAVSAPLARELEAEGLAPGRIACIPNAWMPSEAALSPGEAREALGVEPGGRWAGWVGRLSAEKGADVFLRALGRTSGADVGAVIIGEGRERAALRELARELGIEERVRWLGRVPSAGRLFPAFDVFVLSSRTEGTPMVLFEAMEAEVPIVATRVGGVPDVVSDDEGWLVPAEDPGALAGALDEALTRPDEASRRAARAKESLRERFEPEAWVATYEGIYRDVLGRGPDGERRAEGSGAA